MKGKTFEFGMEGGLKKENDSVMTKEMFGDKGNIVAQAVGCDSMTYHWREVTTVSTL